MRRENVFKAIADPTRRRILTMLKKGPMSAGEIGSKFEMTMGSLTHHYNILRNAELIRSERRGQQIVYSLNTSVFEDVAATLLELFRVERKAEKS